MNIVTIITKKGFKIVVPVWRIGGLVTKNDPPVDNEPSTFFINILGEESYAVDESVFRHVSDKYLEWLSKTSPEAITSIALAEQVSKSLTDVISQVGGNIKDLTEKTMQAINESSAAFKETTKLQANISTQANKYHTEVVDHLKDVSKMAKTLLVNVEGTLKSSETATNAIIKVSKRLEKVTESLDKIEALNLVN